MSSTATRGDELPLELATEQGRRGWLREAKQRLEAERAANPQPVPRSRAKRVKEAKRRLEQELWTEVRASEAYEAYRARGRMKDGRRFGKPPTPYTPPTTPDGGLNVTDPDSRVVKGLRGFIQGYNAQAVTNEHQVVLAAEVLTVARISASLSRCSTPLSANLMPRALPIAPACCSRTPATGITNRWNASSIAASRS